MRIAVCLFLSLASALSSGGQSSVDESRLIHFGDIIDVDVVGSLEFDWRGQLNPEGFLDGMNTYGEPLYGLCRSEAELAEAASTALSKTLKDPKIVVRVVDRSRRAVATLDGAVRSPYRFDLRRPARLQELLVLAGGITDDAGGEVQIFRPPHLACFRSTGIAHPVDPTNSATAANVESPLMVIKISELLTGKSNANLLIRSGDLITVLRAAPFYVIGGVNDAGPILSAPGLTLSRAIAMAGGLSKVGNPSGVTIYRRVGGIAKVIEADLLKIESRAADDLIVLPMDIIEVPQKNKARQSFAPVVEASRGGVRPSVLPLRIIE